MITADLTDLADLTDHDLLVALAQSFALVHAYDAAGDEARSGREEADTANPLAAEAERRGLNVTAPYAYAEALAGEVARTVHHLTR